VPWLYYEVLIHKDKGCTPGTKAPTLPDDSLSGTTLSLCFLGWDGNFFPGGVGFVSSEPFGFEDVAECPGTLDNGHQRD
jgi:hypothetical protein